MNPPIPNLIDECAMSSFVQRHRRAVKCFHPDLVGFQYYRESTKNHQFRASQGSVEVRSNARTRFFIKSVGLVVYTEVGNQNRQQAEGLRKRKHCSDCGRELSCLA